MHDWLRDPAATPESGTREALARTLADVPDTRALLAADPNGVGHHGDLTWFG